MVEEALGKSVKQLKQERTSAKSAFTKQANYLSKAADGLVKHELKRSSTSSAPWQDVSAMQMMTTGLVYWQRLKQELRRMKKSSSTCTSRLSLKRQ